MAVRKNFDSREDIIQALAVTAGASERDLKNFSESKYDSGTGTYYCHGKMFSKMSMFRAKNYFADQAQKYNKIGSPEAREMAQMFDLAYEAIDFIERSGTPTSTTDSQ